MIWYATLVCVCVCVCVWCMCLGCRDYRHLDVYNEEGIDEGDCKALSPEARTAAQREMCKMNRHGRGQPCFYG